MCDECQPLILLYIPTVILKENVYFSLFFLFYFHSYPPYLGYEFPLY